MRRMFGSAVAAVAVVDRKLPLRMNIIGLVLIMPDMNLKSAACTFRDCSGMKDAGHVGLRCMREQQPFYKRAQLLCPRWPAWTRRDSAFGMRMHVVFQTRMGQTRRRSGIDCGTDAATITTTTTTSTTTRLRLIE